jgi:FkbM family methyltransferase
VKKNNVVLSETGDTSLCINNHFPYIESEEEFSNLVQEKCILSENIYGKYCVPKASFRRIAAQRVLNNKVYEPNTIKFIIDNCNKGDIVHAGTYFGDFLPALSKNCGLDAKVWGFEPNPENYCCTALTLEINHISNVVLANAGLGKNKENLLMKVTDDRGNSLGGGSQIMGKEIEEEKGLVSVQIVAIDDVVSSERFVSIIQLDVEGHEIEALQGGLKTIERCRPILIIEDWPNSSLFCNKWFIDNIYGLGYEKVRNIHDNTIFICEIR